MAQNVVSMDLSPELLNSTLGILLIGYMFASILYGVNLVQIFTYFRQTGKTDSTSLRVLIFILFIIDTIHVALMTHAMYYYLITNFAHPEALKEANWSIMAQVFPTSFSDLIVRSIFVRRIWTLSERNLPLALANGSVTLFSFVMAIVYGMAILLSDRLFETQSKLSGYMYGTLAGSVVADIIIAVSLCWILWHSRTGLPRTNWMIHTLIMYAIGTGLFTGLCAACTFIMYAVLPNNLAYIAIPFSLGKLYVTALLTTLNGRSSIREKQQSMNGVVHSFDGQQQERSRWTGGVGSIERGLSIRIQQETDVSFAVGDSEGYDLKAY